MKLFCKENYKYTALLSFICLFEATITSALPHTQGAFFDALEKLSSNVSLLLFILGINYILLCIVQSAKKYIQIIASQLNRKIASEYIINHVNKLTSGAQRLQDDVKTYYQNSISVVCELFISGVIVLILFVLNIENLTIIFEAILFSILSLFINSLFNKKLRSTENSVQQAETEFRDMVRKHQDLRLIDNTISINLKANKVKFHYALWASFQNNLIAFIPYILLTPFFLSGKIHLGEFISTASTFSMVAINCTILVNLYPNLIQAQASKDRVKELLEN